MHSMTNNQNIQKGAAFLLIAASVFWVGFCFGAGVSQTDILRDMRGFSLVLWSILFEALPFVLLGIIVSSLIQVFVTEDMILRIMPDNRFMRLVFAAMIGLIFPVCECAIIPITRGLMKKGMPVGPAITFMLATPIVNLIVLLSTYNAFTTMPQMMPLRAACGFVGAIVIGALVSRAQGKAVLKGGAEPVCAYGAHHGDEAQHGHSRNKRAIFRAVMQHTNAELQSVGMYLIFGAVIAAAVQMAVPTDVLTGIGGGRIASIAVMMALAFLLSLCSEADAFVANTFLYQFSGASVLAFLIVGPMIDLKNTFMMFGSFSKKFTIRLILTILLVCFALALVASLLIGGMYG
ncbi:MAG: permease [Clostridiales bacterium]|nr:permease [Clostridiales bacterium]